MGLFRVPSSVVLELHVDFGRGSLPPTIEKQNDYFSGRNKQRGRQIDGRVGCKRDLSTRPRISAAFSSIRSVSPQAFEIHRLSNRARGISEENEGRRQRNRFAVRKTADANSQTVLPPGRPLTPTAKLFCRPEDR
jgi:hypothetical protein